MSMRHIDGHQTRHWHIDIAKFLKNELIERNHTCWYRVGATEFEIKVIFSTITCVLHRHHM